MKKALKWLARSFGYEIRPVTAPPRHIVFDQAMDGDYELLKEFANRAAQFSASADEMQAVRNLHLTEILKERPYSESSRIEVGNANTLQVGIWRKESSAKDAPFARRTDCDVFEWANKESIEKKRSKWRVAFVGESVARGYLYDPEFTPASALEGILRSYLGAAEIDVVDLAKLSLTMQPLKELIGQSLALLPDIIVVFAGNNWHRHLEETEVRHVESILRKEGVPGMKSFIDARAEQAVRHLTSQVNSLLSGRNITVIWVVPEFNLGDWIDPLSNAPHLKGQGNKQWRDLWEKASQAFSVRDLIRAEPLAREMVDLDGGTNAAPLRILAECCRSKGDLAESKRYLEMARDAEGWDPSFAYSPRTSSVIQNALREAASFPNNIVVDLPDLFNRYLKGSLPDRRIFLDYCHLSAEGINLAMAAVASKVLESLAGQIIAVESAHSKSSLPSRKIEGIASFLAAVHNAHYYQGHDVVLHWCKRALEFWPECAELMTRMIDFQTRRGPLIACKSAIELFGRRELVTLMRGGKKRLDILLCDALVESLKSHGIDIGQEVSDLRLKEHSPGSGPKDLTDFYYSSTMLAPWEQAWTSKSFATNRGSRCIYASAFWKTSKFVFLGEKGRTIGLKFTHRIPNLQRADATVEISVNGRNVAQHGADRTWKTLEARISGDYLVDGLNEVIVIWPDQEDCSALELNRAADALLARRVPRFYGVFGEIHALSVFDLSEYPVEIGGTHGADVDKTMVVN